MSLKKNSNNLFPKKILADTSFLISLENNSELYISTIVWSEFFKNREMIFPILENFKFISFNRNDAEKVWELFDKEIYKKKENKTALKDDFKIASQAIERNFDGFITVDNDYEKIFKDKEIIIINTQESPKKFLGQLFDDDDFT